MAWLLSHRYNRYDPNKPETMKKHINELRFKKNGFVWWGVIQKSYLIISKTFFKLCLDKNQQKFLSSLNINNINL